MGLLKRVISPSSATSIAAATIPIPRSACSEATTGARDHSGKAASICASSRSRRAVAASTAAMAIFQHDIMNRPLELQIGQPAAMRFRPGRPVIVMAMPQQEAGQLLACLTHAAHGCLTCTHEIAHRLVGLIRYPNRGQLPGPMQCGKFARVAPVGLDPLARLSRDQRRSHHGTLVPKPGELSLNAIAARAGFIAEPKFAVVGWPTS